MQKILLTFVLFFAIVFGSLSQDFAGKRIFIGNINLSYFNTNNSTPSPNGSSVTTLSLNTNFLTGKVKANDTYIAYGFNFGVLNNNGGTSMLSLYQLGPAMQLGKFIKVFDKFYFAPRTRFSIEGKWDSSESTTMAKTSISGLGIKASVSPLSFVYRLNDKLLFDLAFGNIGLDYQYTTQTESTYSNSTHQLNLYGNIANAVGIGAFYLF